MWKLITIVLCIFYTNNVQAHYNTGIKTRVYEQHQQQPITHAYHHHHQQQQQQQQHYQPTHGHYHHYNDKNNDRDYQTPITQQYVSNDNSYQQQQHEGAYYQPAPTTVTGQQTHRHTQHSQQQHRPQQHQQPPQSQTPPIYQRPGSSNTQITGNWQNSENSITEYYTGCPSGHTGQLPYAYDCRRFLNCWNGRGHIQTCSVGTVFNPETLECDSPNKVKCEAALGVLGVQSVGQSPAPNHGSLKQPTQPNYRAGRYTNNDSVEVLCPEGAQGLQPHPSDCTRFINCANGNMHIQQCGPGTAYSIPLKVCDFKNKVDCSGREGGDLAAAPRQGRVNNPGSTQWSHTVTTQNQPPSTVYTQTTGGNRWTNMNVHRPQSPPPSSYGHTTTWQHTTNTQQQNPPPPPPSAPLRPDNIPVWSGTAEHVDHRNPAHTIIYEEGTFEPNRNYNRQTFNTPSQPLKPTTTTNSTSTVVYAQPVGSQEDSRELFPSNTPTKPINSYNSPQYYPNTNRQDHIRNLHVLTPIRPIDIPRHDLMPPQQARDNVFTNTPVQIPITQPRPSQGGRPIPVLPRDPYDRPPAYLPPFSSDNSGQKPLSEPDFKVTTINIDQLPGQISYTLDQLPAASSKHHTNDDSNLYGGLQPPVGAVAATTPASHFLDVRPQPTQVPPPGPVTQPIKPIAPNYPKLSNATIQTFPHQPHYSPPYAEVTHAHNSSLAGRKIPQQSNIKPYYRDPLNSENTNVKITSPPPPHYYGLNPPPHANREEENNEPNSDIDDPELAMKAALKLLLKPYINPESNLDDNVAEKAQSHIMSLVSNTHLDTTTTTTHSPPLPSNRNTLVPSSTTTSDQQDDVELILAGEQHNLVGLTTVKTGDHETSTAYNLHQSPSSSASERSSLQPKQFTHNHQHNSNWYKHHHHHQHSQDSHKFKHNREFHEKHPNLPNPFDVATTTTTTSHSVNSYNPRAEATTPRTYDFDLRVGGRCPFNCGNGKCIEENQVCDGVNNCGNRKDEEQCDHLGYELRLTGGPSVNMGRVEVRILGKWGYVCDDKFGLLDADVVCRELGFKAGAMEVRGNSYYAPSDVNVYFAMDEVQCKGNETSLKECDFKGWGVNNCGPDEVVGVVCKVPKLKCPDNYWLCSTSKECIPTAFLCDVTPDCEDGSDESEQVCNAPIKYRLEGGRSSSEGRLEVFYRGEWGTVCDDDFGLKEAQVVCNSFGLYGKPEIAKNIYGPGTGPIWLDQVSCLGNETKIDECSHWSWGENNCNHTEDVGLKCTAGPKPNPAKTNTVVAPAKDKELELEFEQSELDDLGLYQGLWQRSSKAINTKKKCGHFKSNLIDEYEHPEERVVNGSIAKRGRHPWQATIRTRGRGGISSHWCGAVIISKKLVLTAAHCLAGYPKGSYFVRMGDHYANIAESSEVDSNIENWYIHEKFRDQKHMNNDIALILLKTPVRFNDYVQPVCLPEKGATLETNRMCTISGWGSIKSGISTPSNILRSAQVPILADEVCSQKNVYANAMTEGMFCAGFLNESVDACDGDSGGPLVCSDEGGETLYGIISWGQHCGYANHPGVYVRVEKYIDWIYDKINLMLQQGKL